MLESIQSASLGDDVLKEDKTTNEFQSWMASLTGKDAALFCPSGTMGNKAALTVALPSPPCSVIADPRSFIISTESDGALCGTTIVSIKPRNNHHLVLEDICDYKTTEAYDNTRPPPARLLCLEITLQGTVMPLADLRALCFWARAQDPRIHVHVDGARLWEAVASGAGTLHEYCSAADSVSLVLSKGLGAPAGAVLVGSAEFVAKARICRNISGGAVRAAGILAAPAMAAVQETFLCGQLKLAQQNAAYLSRTWAFHGGQLVFPTETNMVWLKLTQEQKGRFVELTKAYGIKVLEKGLGRVVVHYQICEDAVDRMCRVMEMLLINRTPGGLAD